MKLNWNLGLFHFGGDNASGERPKKRRSIVFLYNTDL